LAGTFYDPWNPNLRRRDGIAMAFSVKSGHEAGWLRCLSLTAAISPPPSNAGFAGISFGVALDRFRLGDLAGPLTRSSTAVHFTVTLQPLVG